jgi:hypothetical protein
MAAARLRADNDLTAPKLAAALSVCAVGGATTLAMAQSLAI